MKFYTDGKARNFSCIEVDDIPLEMPESGPQFFIPVFTSANACRDFTGSEPQEIELNPDWDGARQ